MTAGLSGAHTPLKCAAWAGATAAVLLAWQALIVQGDYGGNWTGLFLTGDAGGRVPPALASRTYLFHGSGFDGQFYRLVAHDPFFRNGFAALMDVPADRYRRILVPGLAWLLAGGRMELIDPAFDAVILGFVFLGAWWLARFAAAR